MSPDPAWVPRDSAMESHGGAQASTAPVGQGGLARDPHLRVSARSGDLPPAAQGDVTDAAGATPGTPLSHPGTDRSSDGTPPPLPLGAAPERPDAASQEDDFEAFVQAIIAEAEAHSPIGPAPAATDRPADYGAPASPPAPPGAPARPLSPPSYPTAAAPLESGHEPSWSLQVIGEPDRPWFDPSMQLGLVSSGAAPAAPTPDLRGLAVAAASSLEAAHADVATAAPPRGAAGAACPSGDLGVLGQPPAAEQTETPRPDQLGQAAHAARPPGR